MAGAGKNYKIAAIQKCTGIHSCASFPSCPILRHMLKYKKAYINTIEIANSIIQILFHLEHDISVSIYAFHLPIIKKAGEVQQWIL